MQKRFFLAGLLCTARGTPTRLLGSLSGTCGVRGEVRVWRVKRMYYERTYGYEFAVTAENVVIARRGGTWMACYFWRRRL